MLIAVLMLSLTATYALGRCGCSGSESGEAAPFVAAPAEAFACCAEECAPAQACRKAECSHRAQTGGRIFTLEPRRSQCKELLVLRVIQECNTFDVDAFSARAYLALDKGPPAVPRHLSSTVLLI